MKRVVFLMMVVLLGVGGYAQEGEYVDLGLPSGTKWKTVNEKGYFDYDGAVALFGKELPSKEQWEELKEKCKWVWVDGDGGIRSGYYVVGPNGKRIFLRAAGFFGTCSRLDVDYDGFYWSRAGNNRNDAYDVRFDDEHIRVSYHELLGRFSVRLVRD